MKIHLCCGDIYLRGYENCDITGKVLDAVNRALIADGAVENINETTLDKYFKFPFEPDPNKRIRREFILDRQMNILEKWPWADNSVDEIVMVNALEHFEHKDEVPHIINEAKRVLRKGGLFKFDFPDMKGIVEQYHDTNPEECVSLLYCNHKNKYSIHNWGYTTKSISNYFKPEDWDLEFKDVVVHDYPSQGVWATRK